MSAALSPDRKVTAALAGRRIDAIGAQPARFPLANSAVVRAKILSLIQEEAIALLVCSAACGADLLALDAALELGIRCRVVIPCSPTEFRSSSVIDRPGNWGPFYDKIIARVAQSGDLIVLPVCSRSALAYTRTNETIVNEATDAAAPSSALAILVWEGDSRGCGDATAEFRQLATKAGMRERTVLTC